MFKSVEESIELHRRGIPCDTGFEYVYNVEEVDYFNIDAEITPQLDAMREHSSHMIKIVQEGEQPFDEFTDVICPAYKS